MFTPVGFVDGMPFPLGLQQVGMGGGGQVALAWAVNASQRLPVQLARQL